MIQTTSRASSLDWKFPIVIFLIYTISCILFELLYPVPGTISFQAITVFFLPYLGVSTALCIFRSGSIGINSPPLRNCAEEYYFLEKCVKILVPFTLSLQLITWIFIWNNFSNKTTIADFFAQLRFAAVELKSIVPIWLSYPNGLCFAAFCLSLGLFRTIRNQSSLTLLAISVLTVFFNDLQTSGRAGMAFVVFIFLAITFWDWRVSNKQPLPFLVSTLGISIFSQMPKVLRDEYKSISEFFTLMEGVLRYSFSYLNTLTELLGRLPEPNWIGLRSFLPLFNIFSRINPAISRSSIHAIENSQVWGFNNYTIAGELIRDFSFIGCFLLPFLITTLIIVFSSMSSGPIKIAIGLYFSGWLVFGGITNILMMGGFFISLIFLFSLSCIYKFSYNSV